MVSFITIVFAFLLGLLAWRLQLIGKRQTEIAEETLLAFNLLIIRDSHRPTCLVSQVVMID